MFHYDPVRPFEARPSDYLETGHFWLREFVTGGVFGFRMEPSGLLTMQDTTGEFDTPAPWPYRRAVSAIRSRFDRDRFRAEVEAVSDYEFYVLAPLGMGIEYNWAEIPPVFGLAIWDDSVESFVSIDVAERVFDEMGLWTIPTVDREVPARELVGGQELIPDSAFADELAAGVVVVKKGGAAVAIRRDRFASLQRVPPEPAGTPHEFDEWLQETIQRESLSTLVSDSDRSLDAWALDSLAEDVGAALARREFKAVGQLATSNPDTFRNGIADRLVELRELSEM